MILRLPEHDTLRVYSISTGDESWYVSTIDMRDVCVVEFEEQVYVVDGRKPHRHLWLITLPVTYGFPATRFPDVDMARFAIRFGYVPTEEP